MSNLEGAEKQSLEAIIAGAISWEELLDGVELAGGILTSTGETQNIKAWRNFIRDKFLPDLTSLEKIGTYKKTLSAILIFATSRSEFRNKLEELLLAELAKAEAELSSK